MMSIRLLFLTAEPWPTFRADVAVLFGKYLPCHGVRADMLAAKAVGWGGDCSWGGGDAFLCEARGGKARQMLAGAIHRFRQLVKCDRSRYQAIQVRDMPVFAAIAYVVARWKQVPFFYWMSFPMPEGHVVLVKERGRSAGIAKWAYNLVAGHIGGWLLYRFVLPRADHVFVQSERMKVDMTAHGIAPAKMTAVPMGVDIDALAIQDVSPIADPRLAGKRVLVYLGTQARPRRIEILFEMLALVKKVVPAAVLVLVGDVDDEGHRVWLRERARAAGVSEDVLWTGWVPMREGWRYVRAAEVGLSPFPRSYLLDSASPTKVPEYLALGVPVVCNDNPDQAAVIGESGAGLCVPYTGADFADAVLALLALPDQAREQQINSGKQYVAAHRDYSKLAANLARQYAALLASQSSIPTGGDGFHAGAE